LLLTGTEIHDIEIRAYRNGPLRPVGPTSVLWFCDFSRELTFSLVGKPEGKGPLGTPRRRWVDNINMGLEEVGWGGID
jgi:hypothetical protein